MLTEAARPNAEWCDLICRTHGIETRVDADAWVSLRRSPPLYPDMVMLREGPRGTDALRRVDRSPGCSVKDSFACLDLTSEGFRPLFDAEWILRPPASPATGSDFVWSAARTPDALRTWGAAHGGGDVFLPPLLEEPAVAILVARDASATIVAGVIGHRCDAVVGLSNLFSAVPDPDRVWADAVAAISAWAPGRRLVGYERGASLAAAHRAGFASIGAVRVWIRDSP
ncbi:MAG: hypothetical protein ACT4OS_03665 [Acidimicrobiales bacterium]